MFKLLKKSIMFSFSIVTIIFTFVPESYFEKYAYKIEPILNLSYEINIILIRLLVYVLVLIAVLIVFGLILILRKSVRIKGEDYEIKIEYNDIFKKKNCKKVINFDECFTSNIGSEPEDINKDSICGQYLSKNPNLDIKSLIDKSKIKPMKSKSKYEKKERYESGRIVQNGNDLLMAFAKLDEDGTGHFFSYNEYVDCLSLLWKEINKYYGQEDVCIPILGSGVTRMDDGKMLTQQQLLDIMIYSYKLSNRKLKSPATLFIVCKKRENFSLNKIEGVL